MVNSVSLKIGFVVGRTNDSYGTKMDQTYKLSALIQNSAEILPTLQKKTDLR